MTLDDEITAAEDLVQVARSTATEHLGRATKDLHLECEAMKRYQDFVNATIVNAESTLRHCRETASELAVFAQTSTAIAQGLLAATRDSIRLMYAAMAVTEELTGTGGQLNASQAGTAHAIETAAPRSCSFCGKTDKESKLVAGPEANICASCTRLACGVLGIELSASETE
ncbi:ClpX C4-type zinc finger protein [Sorangium sp. So ce1014]|uniref:ClpX C4-type zinc finger protein n=1 Tax=Sorangium sp. So ce1014 TaxID=3133326 RepID=UPI003F612BD9